jgi:hypothetical protein
MINRDHLNYLKRATPAELMKLTNGIPWEWCGLIKVQLTNSKARNFDQTREALEIEKGKWMAAGALLNDPAENMRWVSEGSTCDECGKTKQADAGRRFTFSREQGFGWHKLCGQCCLDFDYHYYPLTLATRWQGRCLTRLGVAQ